VAVLSQHHFADTFPLSAVLIGYLLVSAAKSSRARDRRAIGLSVPEVTTSAQFEV
jgi:hypothetical protein